MFWFIKQVFSALLSFTGSLATKCVSLSNQPCTAKPTLIDLSHLELMYDPFMVSLDKCNGTCNATDDLSTKKRVSSKIKDINIRFFNMATG